MSDLRSVSEIKVAPTRKRVRPSADSWKANDDANTAAAAASFDDEIAPSQFQKVRKLDSSSSSSSLVCPYLDTINRRVLDFDFSKVCSVTSSDLNVYQCLVCGKMFTGRAVHSPAYFHALHEQHHVFMHTQTGKIFCLPDDYQVKDPSLADIQYNLFPTFDSKLIKQIQTETKYVHALDGTDYLPGAVGMSNLGKTDWLNSVIQVLMRVEPLTVFFLDKRNYADKTESMLVHRFGELLRKMFNPKAFKSTRTPHEFVLECSARSDRRFTIGKACDTYEFVGWLLNTLHQDLGGSKKRSSSIISRCFQGMVKCDEDKAVKQRQKRSDDYLDDEVERVVGFEHSVRKFPFLYLSMKLPPVEAAVDMKIPTVNIVEVLKKFDGATEQIDADGTRKLFGITRLPPYLLLHMKRFTKNVFGVEKNKTIVNFPIRNLDFKPYIVLDAFTPQELAEKSVADLKAILKKRKIRFDDIVERDELFDRIIKSNPSLEGKPTRYELISSVSHTGEWEKGVNKAYVRNQANKQWYEIEDMHVSESMPQLVAVSESYLQLWKLQPLNDDQQAAVDNNNVSL